MQVIQRNRRLTFETYFEIKSIKAIGSLVLKVILISSISVHRQCQLKQNQFSSVQSLSRVRLCDPMNRSTPGLPVHHQLPEFTQTHTHRVSDAIQPSPPLSSPSPAAPNPSQLQSFPKYNRNVQTHLKKLKTQSLSAVQRSLKTADF